MNKLFFWAMIFIFACTLLYLVSDTLSPFLIAFTIAYILQPAIEANSNKFHLPRGVSTFGIFTIFLGGFIAIAVLIFPIFYKQFAMFVAKIPKYKSNFEAGISQWSDKLNEIDPEIADKVSESANSFVNSAFTVFASFANHIWEYTMATINFFAIVALVPIILYYFLRDWPKMVSSVESVLPVKGKGKVREIFNSINELLSAYIRGQLLICTMLALYYIVGLSIIGLDLALLIGLLSGFLIIIPFIGAFISLLLMTMSCYFTYGSGMELVYVLMLFVVGHGIEGYILVPKVIGNRIGLHPVWIIFAVFACGSLFGILGVVFAIPIAGIAKVIISNIIDYYKSTNLYRN